jgi:hypothetical protein
MGWAEERVKDYHRGHRASWLERRMLEHANPVHFALALAAAAGFAAGLWLHDWVAMGIAALLALAGHVYCWTRKPAIIALEAGAGDSGAGNRPRLSRHADASTTYRAGSLVRALSWYGSHGRARRAAQGGDQREREAS